MKLKVIMELLGGMNYLVPPGKDGRERTAGKNARGREERTANDTS